MIHVKNCNLTLNKNQLFVSEADIDISVNATASYLVGNRIPSSYPLSAYSVGSLRVKYFVTGRDFVLDYLGDRDLILTGDFAGLTFTSGHVVYHSVNGGPFSPVIANAEISFFGDVSGTFNLQRQISPPNIPPLNFSEASIQGVELTSSGNIQNISYNATQEVDPIYLPTTGEPRPVGVLFGNSQATLEITTDDYIELPYTGKLGLFRVSMKDYNGNIVQTYDVSGLMTKKSISVIDGGQLGMTYSVRQDSVLLPPVILNVSNSSVNVGETITISGNGYSTVDRVMFGFYTPMEFSVISDEVIEAKIPQGTTYGYIYIFNEVGFINSDLIMINQGQIVF